VFLPLPVVVFHALIAVVWAVGFAAVCADRKMCPVFYRWDVSVSSGWPQTWNTQGFLWTWKTQRILREFCATSGKNCNKQSIFSSSFKYLVRVQWWPVILLELMWNDPLWRPLLHLLFFVITYWKVSLWLRESLENSENFFLYFVATLIFLQSRPAKSTCK